MIERRWPAKMRPHSSLHLGLLGEEAPGRVGDRAEVVADLEDRHGSQLQRDALLGDALLLDLGLAQRKRQVAPPCAGSACTKRAVPGDDPKLRLGPRALGARRSERLVGRGDVPEQHCGVLLRVVQGMGVTVTERVERSSTTTTRVYFAIGSIGPSREALRAAADGENDFPGPWAGIGTVR